MYILDVILPVTTLGLIIIFQALYCTHRYIRDKTRTSLILLTLLYSLTSISSVYGMYVIVKAHVYSELRSELL